MRVTVIGLWHLGTVTAAGLAKLGHKVIGLELGDPDNLERLRNNFGVLNEPGLSALIAQQRLAGRLDWSFATQHVLCCDTDVLWVCHDINVSSAGRPDASACLADVRQCLNLLPAGKLVVLTSQLPIGTCASLERDFPQHRFAVIPENLRIGKAIASFERPARTIVGLRDKDRKTREEVGALLTMLPGDVLTMSPESAEMTKHALNAFLALSVTFINEVGRVCDRHGADASDVAKGLMSDERIGRKAYLRPGAPFTGWTLVRDLTTLTELGESCDLHVIPAIKPSNDTHAALSRCSVAYGKTG